MGNPNDAVDLLNKAMRLDPGGYSDYILHFLAHAYFMLEHYEEAAELLERRISLHSGSFGQGDLFISQHLLATTYGHLGKLKESRAAWDEVLRLNPKFNFDEYKRFLHNKNPSDMERLVQGLRKAGLVK